MIIDGRKISAEIIAQLKEELSSLQFRPKLVDVVVGEDPVTESYVKIKAKKAAEIGVDFQMVKLPADISEHSLLSEIEALNKLDNVCGIIVQLPLPEHMNRQLVLDAIEPKYDVDVISSVNSSSFYMNQSELIPPTAAAIIRLLKSLQIDLSGKKILVVGAGDLVGKPTAALLKSLNAEVTVVDKNVRDLKAECLKAEIIISGTGVPKLITSEMVKPGQILIDAGTAESAGGISGDIDFEVVKDTVEAISPVPGGVGPVTVAMLLWNVVQVAKKKNTA